MSEIDDLRRRVARLENALAGFDQWTLPGLCTPCVPRLGVKGDGTALNIGTYDYTVTDYGVPPGVRAVWVYVLTKWTTASATSTLSVFSPADAAGSYLRADATVSGAFQIQAGPVPVSNNKILVKVEGANTAGTYIFITGYVR